MSTNRDVKRDNLKLLIDSYFFTEFSEASSESQIVGIVKRRCIWWFFSNPRNAPTLHSDLIQFHTTFAWLFFALLYLYHLLRGHCFCSHSQHFSQRQHLQTFFFLCSRHTDSFSILATLLQIRPHYFWCAMIKYECDSYGILGFSHKSYSCWWFADTSNTVTQGTRNSWSGFSSSTDGLWSSKWFVTERGQDTNLLRFLNYHYEYVLWRLSARRQNLSINCIL